MLAGFDHVTIAVADLDAAAAGYERLLGCAPDLARRSTRSSAARSALFALSNAAVELVAPLAGRPRGRRACARGSRTRGEGLQASPSRPMTRSCTTASLRERGLRATPPQPGEARNADGGVRGYRTVELSPRATPRPLRVRGRAACDGPLAAAPRTPPAAALCRCARSRGDPHRRSRRRDRALCERPRHSARARSQPRRAAHAVLPHRRRHPRGRAGPGGRRGRRLLWRRLPRARHRRCARAARRARASR